MMVAKLIGMPMNERFSESKFPVKTFPYRVYYADTDAGGVMYYAQYLRMAEQMRALYVEQFELSLKALADEGILFACRRAETDYLAPALLDDVLMVETVITEVKAASIRFEYQATCPARSPDPESPLIIANCITLMACCQVIDGAAKPMRIPRWVMEKLQPHN